MFRRGVKVSSASVVLYLRTKRSQQSPSECDVIPNQHHATPRRPESHSNEDGDAVNCTPEAAKASPMTGVATITDDAEESPHADT